MIENEKVDCIDALVFGLNRTSLWRQKMAAQYPADPRNARAVECLSKLSTDARALTDEDWSKLQPHSGWANERWREAISQAARGVGFQHKIKELPAFVTSLVAILWQSEVTAS